MTPEEEKIIKKETSRNLQLDILLLDAADLLIKIRDAFYNLNDTDLRLKIHADYVIWNIKTSNFLADVDSFDYFTKWLTIKEFQPKKYPKFNIPVDEKGAEIRDKIINDLNELKSIIGEKKVILDEIKNSKESLESIATKDEYATITKGKKIIHLPHFPSTPYKDATIRFLDERNVLISTLKKTATADYEGLGFSDDKSKKPNLAWNFLLGVAKNNGETEKIQSPIPDSVKQIKRQISDFLKKLFKNDTEPFYDFSETNTYKIKITLKPPQIDDNNNQDKFGVKEYLNETMTSKYEFPKEEGDW